MAAPLLSVKNLRTWFDEDDRVVRAVDDVSFEIGAGETLGIVGESGSGKSVTNLSIMRLVPTPPGRIVSGEIVFDGQNLLTLSDADMRALRGKRIAMVFQDPMTSLNPFLRISTQLMEVTQLHLGHSKAQAREHAIRMLETVGIPDPARRLDGYPHELSGGMRQRVMIAMALSCRPSLLIADEPTTALDVTIQAQILDLIRDLRREIGTSVILITHDLGVVAGMADRVVVMYAGKVFETARTSELLSVPDVADMSGGSLYQIPGLPPDVSQLPPGCPFAARCDHAKDVCHRDFPPYVKLADDHFSLCHFAEDVYREPVGAHRGSMDGAEARR
jgi:oligopeptide transport system ATP-binding protein